MMAWFGLVWLGLAWFGLVWLGLAWFGLVWLGLARVADATRAKHYMIHEPFDLPLEISCHFGPTGGRERGNA